MPFHLPRNIHTRGWLENEIGEEPIPVTGAGLLHRRTMGGLGGYDYQDPPNLGAMWRHIDAVYGMVPGPNVRNLDARAVPRTCIPTVRL